MNQIEGIIFVFIHLYSIIPSPNIYANPNTNFQPIPIINTTLHQKYTKKHQKNTNFGQFLGARGQFTVIAATF